MKELHYAVFIALCFFLLVGLSPVTALPVNTALPLAQGDVVFLGETGVVVNPGLLGQQVAFFSNGNAIVVDTVDVNFDSVNHPAYNVNTLGPWYLWDGVTQGPVAFILVEPSMSILTQEVLPCDGRQYDRTGAMVMNSRDLEFVTGINQSVYNRGTAGQIVYDIYLSDGVNPSINPVGLSLLGVQLNPLPDIVGPWVTGAVKPNGQYDTPPGVYSFMAQSQINGLLVSSPLRTVTLTAPSVTIQATPASVQRGNSATVTILGEPDTDYYFGIIECPLRMTGAICDRPPWIGGIINGSFITDPQNPHNMDGTENLVPNCCGGIPFNGVIPVMDPVDFHSRYIGITTDCNGVASFLIESDATVWKALEPVEYTLHVQKAYPEQDGTTLFAQTTISYTKGDVTLRFFDATDPTQTPITEAYLGDFIGIDGTNTESNITYLYMTGPCQPECGGGLFPDPYPFGLLGPDPETAAVTGGSWVLINPNGDPWWDTSVLPINPGTYTIYALSDWPSGCPDCVSCGGGTCELLDCPNCLVYAVGTITLKEPVLEADVIDIERCCCPGYPCGTTIDTQPIWVDGISTGNTPYVDILTGNLAKDVNVWLFGEGKVGDLKFLNWKESVPCDGAFNFSIPWRFPRDARTEYLLWDIPLCSLDPGTYDLVIQTKGYNQEYDVLYERDIFGTVASGGIPVERNKRWIVTTYPVNAFHDLFNDEFPDYAKVVQVEGPGYKLGSEVLQAMLSALENPNIDDQYVHLQFTITDRPCLGGANFEADRTYGNKPLSVKFSDLTLGGSTWLWDFGDGQTSTEQHPTHVYDNEGRYTVSLTIDGDSKGKVVKNDYIRVAKGPTAQFKYTPKEVKAGETEVQFTDLSLGNPTSWMWHFGDGASSPLQSPVYTYPRPGVYNVRLTVSDELGLSSQSVTQTVTVTGDPVPEVFAGFRTVVSGGTTVQFIDESLGNPTAWSWDFGDGQGSLEQNPVYTYQKEGTYLVTLTVSNELFMNSYTKRIGIR